MSVYDDAGVGLGYQRALTGLLTPRGSVDPTALPMSDVPDTFDHATYVTTDYVWHSLGNGSDVSETIICGDCVEAYGGHLVQLWTAMAGNEPSVTVDETVQVYADITGYDPGPPGGHPNFATDLGTDPLKFFEAWKAPAKLWGQKGGYYFQVPPGYVPLCTWLYGGIGVAVALPNVIPPDGIRPGSGWAIPTDPSWTGAPDPGWTPTGVWKPGSGGGHFVLITGCNAAGVNVVTWGMSWTMTWGWWNTYVEPGEMWAAAAQCMIGGSGETANGYNPLQLAAWAEKLGVINPTRVVIPPPLYKPMGSATRTLPPLIRSRMR